MHKLRPSVLTCCIGFAFGISLHTYAQPQFSMFESTRRWAHGGTYSAASLADDTSRFNVATLSENKETFQLRVADADVFLSNNVVGLASDLADSLSSSDGFDVLRKFGDHFGERQALRLQLALFGIRVKGFDFEPFVVTRADMSFLHKTLPEASLMSDTYGGVSLSYGHALPWQNTAVGLAIRPMMRKTMSAHLSITELLDFLPPSSKSIDSLLVDASGSGIGVDLGATWKPKPNLRFGLMWQNIGDTQFSGDVKPPALKQRLNVGTSYRYTWKRLNWDSSADYQDITNSGEVPWLRHLHLGTEVGISYFTPDNDAGLAMGIHEGYLTMGAFVDAWLMRIEFANYGVEDGVAAGQLQNRFWALSVKSSFSF